MSRAAVQQRWSDEISAFERLKRRKIVQWALAYLAAAWVLAEVTEHLVHTWGFPPVLVRTLHVLLVFGFFATLILAWYHGEVVQGDAPGTAAAMREAIGLGKHRASWERDPAFSRVRGDSEIESVPDEVARLLERQRREIERDLAESEWGLR